MDPYAPCPCGSGKKVKFCCHKLIPEMERIERLQENQPEQALVHLDKLEQTSPGNPWVVTTRAGTLMQQGEFGQAKIALLKFLREHPDHPRANALYAYASFQNDGYPASKKAVHRAFKRCVQEAPRIVSALLQALGELHFTEGRAMAARAHFLAAVRVASTPEDRDLSISSILRLDGEANIPFLFRGSCSVPDYEPPAASADAYQKARHLALLACWEEAADLLQSIAEHDPQSAELQHLIGLFRAWDGNEPAAAAALHRAAELYGDVSLAIECESLAQLLDRQASDRAIRVRMRRYHVQSVSQLLSRLDEQPRFCRVAEPRQAEREGEPSGGYVVLDRPRPSAEELPKLTADTAPLFVGRVMLFDASPEDELPAVAYVTGLEGEQLDSAVAAFTQAAGDLAERMPDDTPTTEGATQEPSLSDVIGEIFDEELPLHRNYFMPEGTPGDVRAAIVSQHWQSILHESWPSTPQRALRGKTPLEAARDPTLRVPLEAALVVLEDFCDGRHEICPLSAIREQLGLPAPEPLTITPETRVATLVGSQLLRLHPAQLTDFQLHELIEQLRITPQSRLLYAALQEWVRRDIGLPPEGFQWSLDREGALGLLASIATTTRRVAEAFDWIARGLDLARGSADRGFEKQVLWAMRGLHTSITYSSRADVRSRLLDLWEKYSRKLPALRGQLTQLAESLQMEPPWESSIITAGPDWSPPAPSTAGEPAKTLWLPGQD